MISRKFKRYHLAALPALTMLCQLAFAQAPAAHGDSTMREYESAGGSPLANVPMRQDINPLAPKMTEAEFDKAKRIFIEVGRAGFRPERHILEDSRQVTAVEELIAGTGRECGAQFQVLKGVLLEVGRREPIQPLRQKEVKLDGPAAVSHDEIAGIVSVDVPAEDGQSQRLAAGGQFAEQASVSQVAVARGL
jgi:hypothetical protein